MEVITSKQSLWIPTEKFELQFMIQIIRPSLGNFPSSFFYLSQKKKMKHFSNLFQHIAAPAVLW